MITNNKQNKKWFETLVFFLVAIIATGSFSSVVFARYSNITEKISEVMKKDTLTKTTPVRKTIKFEGGKDTLIRNTIVFTPPIMPPLYNKSQTEAESNRLLGKYLTYSCPSLTDQKSSISILVNVRFDINGKVISVQPGDKSNVQFQSKAPDFEVVSKALYAAPAFKLRSYHNEIGDEVNYLFTFQKRQCTVTPLNLVWHNPAKEKSVSEILNDTISERDSMTFKFVKAPPPPIVKKKPNSVRDSTILKSIPPPPPPKLKNSNGLIGKSIPPPPPPSEHLLPWPLFNGSSTLVESGQLMGKYLTDNCDFSASLTDQKTSISILVRVRFDTNGKVKSVQPGNKSDVMLQSLKTRNVSDKASDFELVSKALYAAPAFTLLRKDNKICDELNYLFDFQKRHCNVTPLTLVFHKINTKE